MNNFFSTDTKFYAAWSMLADLVIINLLMIATALPIFTGGAATRAAAVVTVNMAKDEGSHAGKTFLSAFVHNWKTPTLWWMISIALTAGIGYEFYIISRADLGTVGFMLTAGVLSGSLVLLGITAWFYPLCALDDENSSLKDMLGTSIHLSISHLPRTLGAVLALALQPMAIYFFPNHLGAVFVYFLLIGNAATWYIISLIFLPVLAELENPGTRVTT